ncbi:MAG: hypothetical protein J7L74_02965 [Candidatus Hydrothermae bacterium]|nr:hypothetical protein [Candidatus Hydrothermae bacterium]
MGYHRLTEVMGFSFNPETLRWGYRFSPWREERGLFYKAFSLGEGRAFMAFLGRMEGEWHIRVSGRDVDENMALEEVGRTLGDREDLVSIAEFSGEDPILSRALEELPGYRLKSTPYPHEALFSAIISQNVSREGFFKMLDEFKELLGVKVEADGYVDFVFPPLGKLRDIDPSVFSDGRLAYRASVIRDIARKIGDDFFAELGSDPASGIETLTKLRGVGQYTARATLLYGYRAYEVPVADRYILKMLASLYSDFDSRDASGLDAFARDRWGEYAGYVIDLLIAWSQKNGR